MGIVASAKGEFLKTALGKLTEGNSGSTLLGAAAAAVLGSGVSFGDLFSSDQTKQAHALGLVAAAIAVSVWGFFIGRKK
jgi:hypothetical protein